MAGIKELKDFIDVAEKNRKYAPQTAKGRRAALKLFEMELNDEEKASLDLIEGRFEKIYSAVHQKNKLTVKTSSLLTYKRRIQSLLKEYRKFGIDPVAFEAWDTTRTHEPKKKDNLNDKPSTTRKFIDAEIINQTDHDGFMDDEIKQLVSTASDKIFQSELNKLEIHLRPGFKVNLMLPIDLTEKEAKRLKHMIDGLVNGDDTGGI